MSSSSDQIPSQDESRRPDTNTAGEERRAPPPMPPSFHTFQHHHASRFQRRPSLIEKLTTPPLTLASDATSPDAQTSSSRAEAGEEQVSDNISQKEVSGEATQAAGDISGSSAAASSLYTDKSALMEGTEELLSNEGEKEDDQSESGKKQETRKSKEKAQEDEDAAKMVKEMLKAPGTKAVGTLLSAMTSRTVVPFTKSKPSKEDPGVVPSKYGGFEYKPAESQTKRAVSCDDDKSFVSMGSYRSRKSFFSKSIEIDIPDIDNLTGKVGGDDESFAPTIFAVRGTKNQDRPGLVCNLLLCTAFALFGIFGSALLWQIYLGKSYFALSTSSIIHQGGNPIPLPTAFYNLTDIGSARDGVDIPFFWHVPAAAGVMFQSLIGQCHGFVQASNFWSKGNNENETLRILQNDRIKYINIDTESENDVERAIRLGFANSDLADVVISPRLHLATKLFNTQRKGRMFAILRHPIERVLTMYQILADRNSDVAKMTVEEFANSSFVDDNWLTRTLVGEEGYLNVHHIDIAKEILRRKCLVGLADQLSESLHRFTKHFKWDQGQANYEDCHVNLINDVQNFNKRHPNVQEGDNSWNLLAALNVHDMEVYAYAEYLFRHQGIVFN